MTGNLTGNKICSILFPSNLLQVKQILIWKSQRFESGFELTEWNDLDIAQVKGASGLVYEESEEDFHARMNRILGFPTCTGGHQLAMSEYETTQESSSF